MSRISFAALEQELDQVTGRVPSTAQYHRLCTLVTERPEVSALNRLDPFSPAYRERVMALYLALRGRAAAGYDPARDEAASDGPPANLWTDLTPWSFRDPGFLGEFLYSWGHILRLMDIKPGIATSVLEYGPGSDQLLLMLARLGVRACGVDIDALAVANIIGQAVAMGLPVAVEQAAFGEGFGAEQFDCIVFFEAFHHAFDFESLLRRLRERLRPGGRLILCGEPVVSDAIDAVPYPWGPRLDALSILCMRRFGWMELGFTHDFLMEAFRRTGWEPRFHPFSACARANAYVAYRQGEAPPAPPSPGTLRRLARGLPVPLRRIIRQTLRRFG